MELEDRVIKVLGICGSPVEDSNTELLLREALTSVAGPEVHTETVLLHHLDIQDCRQCDWCLAHQTPETACQERDDLPAVMGPLLEADAVLVASPVYIARMTGRLAALFDRLRCTVYGKTHQGALKHKVGAALAVGWFRNAGIETTLASIHWAFLTFQMVIAAPGPPATFGGGAVSSIGGSGRYDPDDYHPVASDEHGLETARATARAMVELARIIKAGRS